MPLTHAQWCQQLADWRRAHNWQHPAHKNTDSEEARLGNWVTKTKIPCTHATGSRPSQQKLSEDELREFQQATGDFEVSVEMPQEAPAEPSRKRIRAKANFAVSASSTQPAASIAVPAQSSSPGLCRPEVPAEASTSSASPSDLCHEKF